MIDSHATARGVAFFRPMQTFIARTAQRGYGMVICMG